MTWFRYDFFTWSLESNRQIGNGCKNPVGCIRMYIFVIGYTLLVIKFNAAFIIIELALN